MIPPEERAKSTLRAVARFGTRHPRWPDAHALRREFPKLGCRATVQATLGHLRTLGLVELNGRGSTARWQPTTIGFDLIGKPPFTPRLAKQRARQDAAILLAQPIPQRHVIVAPGSEHALMANLDVME